MITIVTGKTGSGKTSILKKANLPKTYYLDSKIKEWYVHGNPLYTEIKNNFGDKVVDEKKVLTHELGKIVFSDHKKLTLLNEIVVPHVKAWISSLDDAIIEMAIYMELEDCYKDLVDNIILISRKKPDVSDKFRYLNKEIHPIQNEKIHFDYAIKNDGDIQESVKLFTDIMESLNK